MSSFAVILPAAGQSSRFQSGQKKPFVDLNGRAVWIRSLEAFVSRDEVVQALVVVAADDLDEFRDCKRDNRQLAAFLQEKAHILIWAPLPSSGHCWRLCNLLQPPAHPLSISFLPAKTQRRAPSMQMRARA